MSDVLTVEIALARLPSSVIGDRDEDALQAAIDEEEALLARALGPLVGERTQTFRLRDTRLCDPLRLRRPTDAVVVTDNGEELEDDDVRLLLEGTSIEPARSWTGPVITAEYEPNDLLEIRSGLLKLLQLTLVDTGFVSERVGNYSYQRFQSPGASESARAAIIRSLRPHQGPGTTRLRSSVVADRITDVAD